MLILSLDPSGSTAIAHAERGQKEKNMGILAWIVVGLIAGWLAGQVMKGGGYGMVGSIIVAFIGAVILVGITRLLKRA